MQDPLSNAVARAKELEAACSNVRVQMLDAGHCPHDEVPQIVNDALLSFMLKTVCEGQGQLQLAGVQEAVSATA